jgi:crossover junction endodeoxyribonuclease RuvC
MRLLGLDPGLRHTGWGVVDMEGNRLIYVADGVIHARAGAIAERLVELHEGVLAVIAQYRPDEAAVEQTFVNKNPESTLKLGLARGVVVLAPARSGLTVAEYAPNQVKKTVVGAGHADKAQVEHMVKLLLPGSRPSGADAADALAVAICHAHHVGTRQAWAGRAALGLKAVAGR